MKQLLLGTLLLGAIQISANPSDSTRWFDFLEAGMFTHSVSLPLEASNKLIALSRMPGIYIGAGRPIWKQRKKLTTHYLITFSAYHQKDLHYGLELSNSLLAIYQILKRIQLEGTAGVGYLHTIEDAAIYKNVDGQFKQIRNWGRPQITSHASIGVGVSISEKLKFTSNYKFLLQLPFARKAGVLFIPHSRIQFGLRWALTKS